jgi:formate C-acetyltransferase
MPIHPKNSRLKELYLNAPYEICIERARYYTQSYKRTRGGHPALCAAKAFGHTVRNMTVTILDDELFAGNRSSKLLGVVIPVERGDVNLILDMELDHLIRRKRQPFFIDEDDRRELDREILPWWRGKTVRDHKKALYKKAGLNFSFSKNPFAVSQIRKSMDWGRLRKATSVPSATPGYKLRGLRELLHNNPALVMNVFDVQGHLVLGHETVLKEGFCGIRQKALDALNNGNRADADKAAFLESTVICCDAVRDFAGRFAVLAQEKAKREKDPARAKELEAMARHCAHVPYHTPRSFAEAVAALWLTQAAAYISFGMVAIFAIGRFDQYLYPFYAKDIQKGIITSEKALRLLEELLIKLGTNLMILPYAAKSTGNELGSDSCAPTVGGVDETGENAANPLSHLILDAFSNVKSLGNSFTIRLSEKTPESFWKKALETYRSTSGAALFYDEAVVPALVKGGMEIADARNYGVIGCVEPAGNGDSFPCTSGNDISLAAAVEMTLLNGRLRMMGKRIGPKTGNPEKFKTFDEFFLAYKRQVSFMIDTVEKAVHIKDGIYKKLYPCPLVSATLAGCIENARDATAGGAKYNFGSIGARGFATALDCLAAIRHFVFEQKALSIKELLEMLKNNFADSEIWRQRLVNKAPKYGCDDDKVDFLACELAAFFCNNVSRRKTLRGGAFRPGFFSYGMHVLEGLYIGALPNGRKAGEPVSNSFSPSNGAERKGPTAALASIAKIDASLISNGCAVNMKFLPQLLEDDERLAKFEGLVKGYFVQGGMELQPNVISNQVLKDAQKNPDSYRDLVVRVSGYSALFHDLGKPLQDEIIARTQFERL